MALPVQVTLTVVGEMVEVRGWTQEPFLLTQQSALKNFERVLSRRSKYASKEEFERHLSIPVEAMKLKGWEVPPIPESPVVSVPIAGQSPVPSAQPAQPGVIVATGATPAIKVDDGSWLTKGIKDLPKENP